MNESEKQSILHKELDIIQNGINRMAQNSFMIKGWYFGTILILSTWKFKGDGFYISIILISTIMFYTINLQFYIYERNFRTLYDERIKLRCTEDDYQKKLYEIKFNDNKKTLKEQYQDYIVHNKILLFLYLGTSLLLIIARLFLKN